MPTKHKIGSRFEVFANYDGEGFKSQGIYILAQVGPWQIALINLETGNRYADPVSIENRSEVSKDAILVSGAYLSEIETILNMDFLENTYIRPVENFLNNFVAVSDNFLNLKF